MSEQFRAARRTFIRDNHTVTVDPTADLARVHRRITGEAIENARVALDARHLPTQLQLAADRPVRPRRNEI